MNNQSTPLVSIIMPTYNSARFVERSIESIIYQTYPNWELLITDDCSTDNTLDIIRDKYSKEKRIKFFRLEENKGAAFARNNSILHANGRFIAFCDSDDRWAPQKLAKQIKFMEDNCVALSYTNYFIVSENDVFLGEVVPPNMLTYSQMLYSCYIGCLTAIYDTQMLGKVYMPNIRKRQDWALWIKITKRIPCAKGLDETLAIYTKRKDSISSRKLGLIKFNWIIYRKLEKLSIYTSLILCLKFLFHYVLKKIKIKKSKRIINSKI